MDSQIAIEEKDKLFNKGFITITTINFIVFLIYYCFVVITAKYATSQLGATAAQAGFAAGIYIIGTLVARLYIGKKLEIVGRKQILRFGALIYLITTAAYLISSNRYCSFLKWIRIWNYLYCSKCNSYHLHS